MQKVLKELFDQFVKTNGREPDNLEMIIIRQKASAEDIRRRKIINMFDRSPVDADQPILGGKNIEETDSQILERLNKGNENSLSNIRYENAVKAEEAKAAADEDYIMQVLDPEDFSKGGRAGLYQGGQAQIEPDLSDVGHGSDALMARNMQLSPGSQATTSTGLNYLLGEDNDTTRVPYKNAGPVILPKSKPKPKADPMVELQRIYDLYQEVAPGVAQETQKYLQQDFINKLNEANISQEQFMTNRMQNHYKESKANGGRIGFASGGSNPLMPMQNQMFDPQMFRQRPFPGKFQEDPQTDYSKMMDKQSIYTPFHSGRIKDEFDKKTQIAFDEGAKISRNQPFDFTKDEFDEQGYSSDMRHGLGSSAFKDAAIDYLTSNTPLKPYSVLANDLGIFAANAGSLFTEIPDMFSQAKAVAESKGPYGSIDDYMDEPDTRFLTQAY